MEYESAYGCTIQSINSNPAKQSLATILSSCGHYEAVIIRDKHDGTFEQRYCYRVPKSYKTFKACLKALISHGFTYVDIDESLLTSAYD